MQSRQLSKFSIDGIKKVFYLNFQVMTKKGLQPTFSKSGGPRENYKSRPIHTKDCPSLIQIINSNPWSAINFFNFDRSVVIQILGTSDLKHVEDSNFINLSSFA